MTPSIISRAALLFAVLVVVAIPSAAQPPLPPPEPPSKPEVAPLPAEKPEPGVKVLEKGPIHEAFAQPGADVRGKDINAPKPPPPPIPEVPPETKPDGANVKWVPGYWQWDAERNDFIWLSGFWRNVPVGRDWQAGEWRKDKTGNYSFSPGFWRPSNMNSWRVDLPEPPKSVESGPSTPSSDPNAIWVPGTWENRNGQYMWRAGYWAQPNGNQIWQPGQYVQTPSGFAYVPGYWDYPLENRGLLSAPVYFSEPLWQNPGWAYQSRYAIGYDGLFNSLYIGPGYNNYYYGDYDPYWYGGPWLGFGPWWGSPWFGFGFGFSPWFAHHHGFFNPLWHHYNWMNRGNPNWANGVHNSFGHAAGVSAASRAAVVRANNQAGVAGAVNAGVRSATANAARPGGVSAANHSLVQPNSQVARSISAANARASGPMSGGLSAGPMHSGASIAPQIHYGSPSGAVYRPGVASNAVYPGVTHMANTPQIHYGSINSPGISGFHSMPGGTVMHSGPTFSSGITRSSGFSGGFSSGSHMGGGGGGGHAGGGGHR